MSLAESKSMGNRGYRQPVHTGRTQRTLRTAITPRKTRHTTIIYVSLRHVPGAGGWPKRSGSAAVG